MRYVDFTFNGNSTNVLVHMEEQADGTILVKLTETGTKGDIRGLFFDVNDTALISKLSVTGANVTGFKAKDEAILDMGNGVNMQGATKTPFDVGITFGTPGNGKDIVSATTFVLKSSVGGLTLDDLALVDMGVRLTGGGVPPKMTLVAPAAPDAHDDVLNAVEDTTIVYHVLDNDTDADGTADFKIVSVTDPVHGTATISADGKTIIYTPDHDYSGADSFGYAMIDGHGGGDNANASIHVEAVADAPTLTMSTAAGSNVNEILVTVTAAVTDTDGSEYIDRFNFSGLPAGVQIVGESDLVYNPTSTTPTLSQTFTLQLAPNTDFNFKLGVTATSKELSNGSEAGTHKDLPVVIDSNHNAFDVTFTATDQSMWGSGDATHITDDRFLGFTVDPPASSTGGFVYGSADLYLKAGFQSTLSLTSGDVNATVPYDISVNTTYNHVTDVMKISSSAALDSAGVHFDTEGPGGSYILDFIFNWALSASAGLDFGVDTYDLFSFSAGSNNTLNILNLDSHDIGLSYDFPYGISASLAWPQIDTTSDAASSGHDFTASGASNNFFELGLDVDQLLADAILKGANPFDIPVDIGVAWGEAELLDVDLTAGLNLLQDFLLSVKDLTGTLVFEDGSTQAWNWSDIIINNASSKDADHDGTVEFALKLDQAADLSNNLAMGVNFGWSVDLLKASGGYDIGVDSGDWTIGPVYHAGDTYNLASIDLYDTTFGLNFGEQTIHFNGNETLI